MDLKHPDCAQSRSTDISRCSWTPDCCTASKTRSGCCYIDRPCLSYLLSLIYRCRLFSPHPGNLLRTSDNKICILDWGMTLSLPRDLQFSLLSFIAHIQSRDVEGLAEDLVLLRATPREQKEEVVRRGIPQGFMLIMEQVTIEFTCTCFVSLLIDFTIFLCLCL